MVHVIAFLVQKNKYGAGLSNCSISNPFNTLQKQFLLKISFTIKLDSIYILKM